MDKQSFDTDWIWEHLDERQLINFGPGWAAPEALPGKEIAESCERVLSNDVEPALQYGPIRGVKALRETLVESLSEDYGVETNVENVVVTTGAKQGLDLLCRALLEPGDTVAVTAPTYATAISIFDNHDVEFTVLPQDGDGILVDDVEQQVEELTRNGEPPPKIIYDVPDFHNPTGITTSEQRRASLVDLADRYDITIVEDSPYRDLRFEGEHVAPIKSFDRDGRVTFLGTYSKVLSPGIRVGWMVTDETLVDRVVELKEDGGTSPLTQLIIRDLHREGFIEERKREYTRTLEEHRDVMVDSIADELPDAKLARVPKGGYYLWVELPEYVNASRLLAYAKDDGVLFYPGEVCFPADGPRNYLRLSYARETTAAIEEGITLLADSLEEYRNNLGDSRI